MPVHPSTRRTLVAATTAVMLTVVAGCSGEDNSDETPSGPTEVTYLTGFGCSAHDSFMFAAQEQGYFEDAGLDVTLQPAGGTENYFAVLEGEAHFTYTELTGMLIDIGEETFGAGDFTALSSVHQNTLVAIVAPESAGIDSPDDLQGKRIGYFSGSVTGDLLPAYAELTGWDFDPDLTVEAGIQDLFGLIPAGEVDALSSFIIQKGVIAGAAGEPLVEFPFNQVLDDLLGTGLIASREYAEENPEAVEAFRDAAIRGLEYTIENPEDAIAALENCDPGVVEQAEAYIAQINIMEPYITASGADRIGVLDEAHVMRCISVLESAGLVPPGLVPEDIIGDGTLLTSA